MCRKDYSDRKMGEKVAGMTISRLRKWGAVQWRVYGVRWLLGNYIVILDTFDTGALHGVPHIIDELVTVPS